MCPENDAVVCQVTPWKASGGWYLPSGSPAIVGNVAYFPARLQKGLSPEEDGEEEQQWLPLKLETWQTDCTLNGRFLLTGPAHTLCIR